MKQTRIIMGMPITLEVANGQAAGKTIERVFDYFVDIDNQFSTYKNTSELSRFNRGEIPYPHLSPTMRWIFEQAEETRKMTLGYFNIHRPDGGVDPSGIVKGWAVQEASKQLQYQGVKDFYIDAGGDIQVSGTKAVNQPWRIGVRNPFNRSQHVKIICLQNKGVATSGTAIRGQHIYDPHRPQSPITEWVSLTVIGPNVMEADRIATAAFAMRDKGMAFIAQLAGFEAYAINHQGIATFTRGFSHYVVNHT